MSCVLTLIFSQIVICALGRDEAECAHGLGLEHAKLNLRAFRWRAIRYYEADAPPPLREAKLLTQLLAKASRGLILTKQCVVAFVLAHILAGEFLLIAPERGADPSEGRHLLKIASELSRAHLPPARPEDSNLVIEGALKRFRDAEATASMATAAHSTRVGYSVDFVVAHCREELDWLAGGVHHMPQSSRLFIVEKCNRFSATAHLHQWFKEVRVLLAPDDSGVRGDEASAYLTFILQQYQDLAGFVIFLHGNPAAHFSWDFLDTVMKSMKAGTYTVPFLPLNAVQHRKLFTPCLQQMYTTVFNSNLTGGLRPYCCAQFVVSGAAILRRSWDVYGRMLQLVRGTELAPKIAACGDPGSGYRVAVFGFEYLWHVLFGEPLDPGSRAMDKRLPVAFRWEQNSLNSSGALTTTPHGALIR